MDSIIISLSMTLVIEVIIAICLKIRDKEDLKVIIFANILTNPVVVFCTNLAFTFGSQITYIVTVIIFEILAVITEYKLYKEFLIFKEKSPIYISIISNIFSFSIGLIIDKIIF